MNPLARFRMTRASKDDSGELHDERYDDTIDLTLSEEDMLALARAAEEELAETSRDKSALVGTGAYPRDESVRSRRWRPWLAASVSAIVIGAVLGVAWSVVADLGSPVRFRVPSAATRSTKSLDSPVRFSNPFDASEVFEFPRGTSDEQARRSVAAILAQRARDRQGAGVVSGDPPAPGDVDRARVAQSSEQRELTR
jgi:hypothetical protein